MRTLVEAPLHRSKKQALDSSNAFFFSKNRRTRKRSVVTGILERIVGAIKKRSFFDEEVFVRLPTNEMGAILGGCPTDPAATAFDIPANLIATRTNYSHPENRH